MTYPTNLSNYTGNETLLAAEHAQVHNNIESKLGIDGSAVTTSHDYKLSGVTGTDKAVSKTGTETLTNKTLTSPVVNTPTGIVKGDVGLGNVDNTSDATKNAAAVNLTNKTITSPVINTGFSGTAKATAAEVATGTDDTKIVTPLGVSRFHNPPQGFLYNGKISVTDAAGITVALKGLDGNDPSATNPVYVRIGDTVRSITAALSVAKADATNWCNAGSTELAALEVDYFVYLGYNATDGVVIGFSRFPGASQYSDFSATTTNEKYCAISTITTAASTDYYQVIGRFAATLSAGAGYTWTVPTFTAKNLIQRPIYETRWLTWLPTWVGYSAAPNGGNLVYKIIIDTMYVNFATDNNGTSNSTAASQATLPMSSAGGWEVQPGAAIDNGSSLATPGSFQINSGVSLAYVLGYKDGSGAAWTGSGTRNLRGRISYAI